MARRNATWANIGTDITAAKNVEEALNLSGLNYNVTKENIYLPNGYKIPDQFATVKEGTNTTFGIVGKEYEIVQNRDAFSFIDSIIPEGLQFVKAGENSNMNYIIAKLPERYIMEDRYDPYIIFQNSHNGYSTLRAAICPLRIICQNQFASAFKKADNKIALRHSSSIHNRLEEAKEVLRTAAAYMDTFAVEAEEMAAIKVDERTEMKILDEYFKIPVDASDRKINSISDRRAEFEAALTAEDNLNFRGTAWGMMNAFSDYITHMAPKRKTENSDMGRFLTVTFDPKLMKGFKEIVIANC